MGLAKGAMTEGCFTLLCRSPFCRAIFPEYTLHGFPCMVSMQRISGLVGLIVMGFLLTSEERLQIHCAPASTLFTFRFVVESTG